MIQKRSLQIATWSLCASRRTLNHPKQKSPRRAGDDVKGPAGAVLDSTLAFMWCDPITRWRYR